MSDPYLAHRKAGNLVLQKELMMVDLMVVNSGWKKGDELVSKWAVGLVCLWAVC